MTIETIKHDSGWIARIDYDLDPMSPEDWCRVGTLAFDYGRGAHNGDDLPGDRYDRFVDDCPACLDGVFTDDVTGARDTCERCGGRSYVLDGNALAKRLHNTVHVLPVRAWDDRNGTELRVADGWDDANGWIYATAESIAETVGADATAEQIASALASELTEWQQYFQGDVYGVTVEDTEGELQDSCGGFYGFDYALKEAQRMLDEAVEYEAEQADKINRMNRI